MLPRAALHAVSERWCFSPTRGQARPRVISSVSPSAAARVIVVLKQTRRRGRLIGALHVASEARVHAVFRHIGRVVELFLPTVLLEIFRDCIAVAVPIPRRAAMCRQRLKTAESLYDSRGRHSSAIYSEHVGIYLCAEKLAQGSLHVCVDSGAPASRCDDNSRGPHAREIKRYPIYTYCVWSRHGCVHRQRCNLTCSTDDGSSRPIFRVKARHYRLPALSLPACVCSALYISRVRDRAPLAARSFVFVVWVCPCEGLMRDCEVCVGRKKHKAPAVVLCLSGCWVLSFSGVFLIFVFISSLVGLCSIGLLISRYSVGLPFSLGWFRKARGEYRWPMVVPLPLALPSWIPTTNYENCRYFYGHRQINLLIWTICIPKQLRRFVPLFREKICLAP